MAEPDRTNADAERVSDIVAYRELAERCLEHMGKADFQTVLNDCHAAARALIAAADIIEAQSKALAEAREALKPFAAAWTGWGDKPDDSTTINNNRGAAYLEGTVITFGDLRRAYATLTPTPENSNG